MEIAGLIISVVAALAGVAAAIFAGVQAAAARVDRKDAETARNESRTARNEAVRLASEANDAFRQQTVELARANELAEAAQPPKMVNWNVRPLSGSRYEVVNVGNIIAFHAEVSGSGNDPGLVWTDEVGPRDVNPEDGLAFFAATLTRPDPRMRITWHSGDGTMQFAERDIR